MLAAYSSNHPLIFEAQYFMAPGVHFNSKLNSRSNVLVIQVIPLNIYLLPVALRTSHGQFPTLFSFGMFHDGEGNYCTESAGKIMSPTLMGKDGQFHWSVCSKAYLMRFLK